MVLGISMQEDSRAEALERNAKEKGWQTIRFASGIERTMEHMLRFPVTCLVLQADMPHAAEWILALRRLPIAKPPHIYLMADRPKDVPIHAFSGVISYLFDVRMDDRRIIDCIDTLEAETVDPLCGMWRLDVLDRMITELLLFSGVSPHLKGFRMLRYAILFLVLSDVSTEISMMGGLYPAVSEMTDSNVSVVEHAMRHAIDTAWMRADLSALEELFGYTVLPSKGTPSNSAYLYAMADRVRIRYQKELGRCITKSKLGRGEL